MCDICLCAHRFGNCVPYQTHEQTIGCDALYTPGVDYIYVSYQRTGGNLDRFLDYIEDAANFVLNVFQAECYNPALRVLCHYYLPPCGNSTTFEPPTSVCTEVCSDLKEMCRDGWEFVVSTLEEGDLRLKAHGATFINCSNTGEYLDPLPHCCSDVGIGMRMSFSVFIELKNEL